MAVAYGLAPRAATKRIERWFGTEEGGAFMRNALEAQLLPMLGPAFEEVLAAHPVKIPPLALDPAVGVAIGDAVFARVKQTADSAAGAVARRAQSSVEAIIMAMPLDSGYALLDGLWASLPVEDKRHVANSFARRFRKAGGFSALAEGDSAPAAASGPAATTWDD